MGKKRKLEKIRLLKERFQKKEKELDKDPMNEINKEKVNMDCMDGEKK